MAKRVVLVTGGARGIGAAICRLFASRDYDILFTYNRSAESSKELKGSLSDLCHVENLQVDVSQYDDVTRLFGFCTAKFGRLDVLVNCASHSSSSGWDIEPRQIDWNEWQKTMDTDVKGTMLCSHTAFELMGERGGKIINFSSSAALYGDAHTYFYTAAKSAVVGITRTMARLFAPTVQVNCVAPGSIATDWITKWKLTSEDLAAISNESPSGRIGKPEEVAELVAFLASPECTYMTGQTFVIDGGIYMP
ncbi:SDR family oxidoreductase [bacterium]|nr:SDR family oxidoreductase [bacterium]MCI0604763.1 SDR family oxidoreductase [bacterium]